MFTLKTTSTDVFLINLTQTFEVAEGGEYVFVTGYDKHDNLRTEQCFPIEMARELWSDMIKHEEYVRVA